MTGTPASCAGYAPVQQTDSVRPCEANRPGTSWQNSAVPPTRPVRASAAGCLDTFQYPCFGTSQYSELHCTPWCRCALPPVPVLPSPADRAARRRWPAGVGAAATDRLQRRHFAGRRSAAVCDGRTVAAEPSPCRRCRAHFRPVSHHQQWRFAAAAGAGRWLRPPRTLVPWSREQSDWPPTGSGTGKTAGAEHTLSLDRETRTGRHGKVQPRRIRETTLKGDVKTQLHI